MKLGSNIRTLRQRKGLTQEQVAAHLGVSYQAVSKWETGANTPDISLLPALAALFDVTIDALFSLDALPLPDGLLPQEDDDVIRVIQMRGKKVLAVTPRATPDSPAIEIAFPRNCNERTQYFKVEVYGHVMADGSINGDVVCHQSIQCSQINGDVHADGDIRANEVTDSGRIVCNGIHDCYKMLANHIECAGDIQSANLTCNQITYKK
ncbi:MAG: helix-turn-helix transcriptional regulator [Clostridia bacterium]|nr:helix-turn-helix transcriptional regulator [Clostridia bacterium]